MSKEQRSREDYERPRGTPYNRQKTLRLTADEKRQLYELADEGTTDVYKTPSDFREGVYLQNFT